MARLLASGRTADVFDLGDGRVRRVYRVDLDVEREAALMRHVAAADYPVPTVHAASAGTLELELVAGPTMAAAMMTGALDPDAGARTLAELHDRLHAIEYPGTADSVLHLDLHPENVIMTAAGPVVLDWTDVAAGPAGLDVASTAVILAQEAVVNTRDLPLDLRPFVATFLAAVTADPLPYLDEALARRRDNPTQTAAERDALPEISALVRRLAA